MAFDEAVAARVRMALARRKGMSDRRMFGGIAFLLNGHMCCGVLNDVLVLRLGEGGAADALREAHTRPMDFTGKPMKSMVYVDPAGYAADGALRLWLRRAIAFASKLPVKE
jgi:TfoX/Sxy family transcriptional regulator of competence genes